MTAPRPRGRRPGASSSRDDVLAAARAEFAASGYEGATMRAIARRAGVDPALVSHHFGSKEGLFAAAVELPFDPAAVLPRVVAGDLDGLGERLVRFFLAVWEDPAGRQRFAAVLRGAVTHERSAELLRGFVTTEVVGRVAAALDVPDAPLRASLVGSQLVGLAMVRYVVGVPPLAGADLEQVVAAVAPTVQRYLTGDL
jgi:AcrR family transcriptional regulator